MIIVSALSLSACGAIGSQSEAPLTSTPSPVPLTPFLSITPGGASDDAFQSKPSQKTATPLPTPTATPFLYEIQSGDTLLAVAQRYNVTLETLLAANPGIDPSLLIVGNSIVIPSGENSLAAFPAPTPIAIELEQPACYPTRDGGLWCLALASNPQGSAVENVAAKISVYTSAGALLDQGTAYAPLNILHAGETTALSIFFPPPIDDKVSAHAELLAALPIAEDSSRYLDLHISLNDQMIHEDLAAIQGVVRLTEDGEVSARQVWVAVIALDSNDVPIGMRKWEAAMPLAPGDELPFEVTVYALDAMIENIIVLAEARP